MIFRLFLWGWVGVENEINAISAFNLVGVEVKVEAELGNSYRVIKNKGHTKPLWISRLPMSLE